VYGYWESARRLIPKAILAALHNLPFDITSPGYRRDLIFIEDVIDACRKSEYADLSDAEILNIGSGIQYSNEQVVALVEQITGTRLEIHTGVYSPSPSDSAYSVANIDKARSLLDWSPQYSLAEGLKKTIEWFKQHPELYPA
jgi:nucleoside-diphosphate-sugar epimerase